MAAVKTFSLYSHNLLIDHVKEIFNARWPTWYTTKLMQSDLLYYNTAKEVWAKDSAIRSAALEMGMTEETILQAPIIRSSIQTQVATLIDTFLSGYPIFGVIAPPERQSQAEEMEALIASYAIAADWYSPLMRYMQHITQYGSAPYFVTTRVGYDYSANGLDSAKAVPNAWKLPQIVAPDLYNTVFDYRVMPDKLATEGDYHGYSEIKTKTALKAELEALKLVNPDAISNLDKAFSTVLPWQYYKQRPPIHASVNTQSNWLTWLHGGAAKPMRAKEDFGASDGYLVTRIYLRLIPEDFGLTRYGAKVPMVFYAIIVNMEFIVYFEPIYLVDNVFPGGMADLYNDYYAYDQQSPPELYQPFQLAASALLNAAVQGANRSVDDRAIYDASYLNSANLTRQAGSAYIPMSQSATMAGKSIRDVYFPIPFDAQATNNLPRMMREVMDIAQRLEGTNDFAQGIPQRGNRTLGEFSEVMNNSDLRHTMPAMLIEAQAFSPMKMLIKQWIQLNAKPGTRLNPRTQKSTEITEETIQSLLWDFRMATGYFSKAMQTNSPLMTEFFKTIQSSEELQQGFDVVKVISHLMSLGGVRDLEQFARQMPQQPVQPQQQPQQGV